MFLGPSLVLVGMVILEVIAPPIRAGAGLNALRDKVQKLGLPGAGLLGLLFAICFCPVSAALFLGSLIPLAISEQSPFLLHAVYGVGTGVPVLVFALILVFGAKSLGSVFQKLTGIERWLRQETGLVILLLGFYLTLLQVFRVVN